MIGFPTRYSSSYVLSRRNRMLLVAELVPSTDTRLNWFLGENLTLHGRLRSRKISAKGYSLESGKYYNFLKYEETVRHFDAGSYFGWLTIDSYENAQKYVKIEKKTPYDIRNVNSSIVMSQYSDTLMSNSPAPCLSIIQNLAL